VKVDDCSVAEGLETVEFNLLYAHKSPWGDANRKRFTMVISIPSERWSAQDKYEAENRGSGAAEMSVTGPSAGDVYNRMP
jgi:hypothetical protein